MGTAAHPTREYIVVTAKLICRDPALNGLPCRLRELELNGSVCLPMDDEGALINTAADADVRPGKVSPSTCPVNYNAVAAAFRGRCRDPARQARHRVGPCISWSGSGHLDCAIRASSLHHGRYRTWVFQTRPSKGTGLWPGGQHPRRCRQFNAVRYQDLYDCSDDYAITCVNYILSNSPRCHNSHLGYLHNTVYTLLTRQHEV